MDCEIQIRFQNEKLKKFNLKKELLILKITKILC